MAARDVPVTRASAYTFITPEQKKYSGHIVQALQLSGAPVEDELLKLWNSYVTEQEAAGKTVKAIECSGFGGKGFQFNKQEEADAKDSRKLQKAAFGLHVDSDEEDEDADLEEQIEDLFKSKRTTKDKLASEAALATQIVNVPAAAVAPTTAAQASASSAQAASIEEKKKAALAIAAQLKLGATNKPGTSKEEQMTKSILGGEAQFPTSFTVSYFCNRCACFKHVAFFFFQGKSVAIQLADKLNMKLNYSKQDNPQEQETETTRVYEEELEINGFPQQARWRITSKVNTLYNSYFVDLLKQCWRFRILLVTFASMLKWESLCVAHSFPMDKSLLRVNVSCTWLSRAWTRRVFRLPNMKSQE